MINGKPGPENEVFMAQQPNGSWLVERVTPL